MNRTLYTLLLYLAVPVIVVRLWLRSRKAPAYAKRIGERFALSLPDFKQGGIWLHAVSVGESIAAAPVVKALQQQYPHLPITVTCMTLLVLSVFRACLAIAYSIVIYLTICLWHLSAF